MVAAPHSPERLARVGHIRPGWIRPRAEDLLALTLVLPLLAPALWYGARLASSPPVLGELAPVEGPLSVRSPVGVWALAASLLWFGLAYRARSVRLWEGLLVAIGGVVVLVRVGNAWLDGVCLLLPLARQVRLARPWPWALAATALLCAVATAGIAVQTRPPALPEAAAAAAQASFSGGRVLADWRWAPSLQARLGVPGAVLAAGGPASEPSDFWFDYARVTLGQERWADILQRRSVEVVVLNTTDQAAGAALVRASPAWQVLDDADGALVARRRTS